jgi:hypothetical protein
MWAALKHHLANTAPRHQEERVSRTLPRSLVGLVTTAVVIASTLAVASPAQVATHFGLRNYKSAQCMSVSGGITPRPVPKDSC